ncbi:MAG: hypothetical protein M1819_001966 [Sarea resinae]|nr:MAG: hypothetical protein M1819_001966 [Sarea resinae]
MTSMFPHQPQKAPGSVEEERADEPAPSRFTAVNGQESSTAASEVNVTRTETDNQNNGSRRPSVSSNKSAERTNTSTRREDWARPAPSGPEPQPIHASTTQPQNDHSTNSPNASAHKRKRSISDERQSSSTASYLNHGLPKSPTREHQDFTDSGVGTEAADSDGHDKRYQGATSPNQDSQRRFPQYPQIENDRRESNQPSGHWYSQEVQASNQPYSAQRADSPANSDAQLAEALQRESQNMGSSRGDYSTRSPEGEDIQGTPQRTSEYGTDRAPQSGVQVDHKRRKRVFSNRTKTGCMTCRRRKKKCDEEKPECNNCMRGGFVCEGYHQKNTWQKPSTLKAPVPLQSKEGYHATSSQANTNHPFRRELTPPVYTNGLPHPPPPLHTSTIEGARVRPIVLDDEHDRSQKAASPHNPSIWSKPSWPNPGNPSYLSEHLPQTDFSRVPPLHELTRSDQKDASATPSSATATHRSLVHPSSTSSPNTPQSIQAKAQLAIQHAAPIRPPQIRPMEKTQKEKMLAGELYLPFSSTLVEERERCKAACWRFNNSTNPTLGVSREERGRLFREILQPPDGTPYNSTGTPSPIGSVGDRVVVDAPFTCDYGYNITIGDDVVIGANCTILDTCSISIGARCIFGPNVQVYGATLPIDPRRRNGSQGPAIGGSIAIEEDCWIGGGVIILPGIRIGKSSTVGAGSVVTRNVPRFTVVAGNPARVHRGIYQNEQF